MEITALFDTVELAEGALVNLQSLGVSPNGYKIQALNPRRPVTLRLTVAGEDAYKAQRALTASGSVF